jgi:tRNA pseudouridine55 synthase
MTSHDVVKEVRRILKIRRVGHMGTLDPQAKGVLLVGIGKGTKMARFLLELPKTYRAVMILGIRTDTQDALGKIIYKTTDFRISEAKLLQVFSEFIGEIDQIPPMFSAIKYKGRPLYSYGRKGVFLERKPRRVRIMELNLLEYKENRVAFELSCSKGTYVRTLCDDIGERLGCGGHLLDLERTKVGDFKVEQALRLEQLERGWLEGNLDQYLYSIEYIKNLLANKG